MTRKEKKTEERKKKEINSNLNREIRNTVGVLYTTFRLFSSFMLSCRGTAKELVVVVRADDEAV